MGRHVEWVLGEELGDTSRVPDGSEAVSMKDQADGMMSVQRMGRSTWMVAMLCRLEPHHLIYPIRALERTRGVGARGPRGIKS